MAQMAEKTLVSTIERPRTSAGGKVVVCSKLPHVLKLRLFKPVMVNVPILGGGSKEVKEFHQDMDAGEVLINGNGVPYGEAPEHRIVRKGGTPFTDGFALTFGVDRDFWERWLEQNKESDLVINGIVFAKDNKEAAIGEARNRGSLKTNLEPMLQSGDPRSPKGPRGMKIEKAPRTDDDE